ncbi:hypothetical protein HZF08_02285 [Paenibacillus sp. CGMCC 1.16610]|uniref:DUF4367 domain-containing protein n=1 Tax=Paenibacillus anseongense TaxID=2682845 RepID=A0ABW9UA77_9BACL|nr:MULTISPECIES: hypothetical protein [Paenibacillus]MBA2937126.1 hypothetical protein [Paenibacillus sp. CGMCC 1.16610]MVQ36188.1 hypothetical protein [Paenibacillus anseongense]
MNKKQDLKPFEDVIDLLENTKLDNPLAKERIHRRLVHKIETQTISPKNTMRDGMTTMNRTWKTATVAVLGVVLIGGVLSTTSYAQGMMQSILAKFHVGNMDIVQVDKELPASAKNASAQKQGSETDRVELPPRPTMTVDEARTVVGMNFPAPSWMADFKYVNTIIHGKTMVEVQYAQGEKSVNFLISQGGKNGVETTAEVKTEMIDGTQLYFANGIVIWEDKGFTVEMYAMDDFDADTLKKIVKSFGVGKPLTQEQINKSKSNVDNLIQTQRAAPAPAARQ